ncbi:MAG: ABC transporter ATP-binding protein [Chloroflexota bacterium]|nr:ABC transporter ATP-binding protein [Dehalococcoidia bacterium]MDW8253421.1 ABC transporter ATP-binding protein [Chloroflexota bacterium]
MTVIRAEELQRTYRSGGRIVRAIDGVSLTVQSGELVAITGRSGSGKTTLLNLLGGLDHPDSGAVWINGQRIDTLDDAGLTRLRRGTIGYVFQSFGLLPTLSAEENVSLPLRIAGVPAAERAQRTAAALAEVGLSARARHRPDELSGGEQQRVAIARALAARPAVILADEPTAELDSANARAIFTLLRSIVDRGEVAVIVATHDRTLLDVATCIHELRDGRLVR